MPPTIHHYLVYDRPDKHLRICAIHHVFDSAQVCFWAFVESGAYEEALLLTRVDSDQYGVTSKEKPIMFYSKELATLENYLSGEITDVSDCPVLVPSRPQQT
jgi:hypothetical protein